MGVGDEEWAAVFRDANRSRQRVDGGAATTDHVIRGVD